ncbi:MAG TPA: hypothetical protein PKG67_03210 [Turneriella sp.]|nr:hypothetical protein [Turneriella sp.]HNA79339.1 hypothetical protein [Turneriella sp.]HNE18703.1 hypothetical protein [Turneriella sp.]HNM99430.1 hypothetical protein [Turneriella sp.]
MKILKTLLVIIVILAGAITGIYAWLGGFSTVAVNRGEIGPWEIVYSTHKGPYKNLNKSWTKFQKDWEAAGLKVCNSLAVYLDMPGTPEDQLRSAIACRIDELAPAEKAALRGKLPAFVIPKSRAVMATFPYKNPASYFVGPMKVYPAFHKVMTQQKLLAPVGIETYGATNKPAEQIGYAMPVDSKRSDYQKLIDSF